MPIAQNFIPRTAAEKSSDSRPTFSENTGKKSIKPRSRCSTPTESSKQALSAAAPTGIPFEGRIFPTETRQELIERKKREQREAWLVDDVPSHESISSAGHDTGSSKQRDLPILPPVRFDKRRKSVERSENQKQTEVALSIERPRSALHRGDFTQDGDSYGTSSLQPGSPYPRCVGSQANWLNTSPTTPWLQPQFPSFSAAPSVSKHETLGIFDSQQEKLPRPKRQRAASYTPQSLGLAVQPPTSPLANETNNNSDSDNEYGRLGRQRSPDKAARRRTFSPGVLKSIRPFTASRGSLPIVGRPLPNVRRDSASPCQAHQPCRSINSLNDCLIYSVPQAPSAHSRRPSLASESSPLQRAPMIGGYEESILRGRMSSLPSRPLDFVAQIGVLGKGKCKSSLRCPPHVSIPFPAVFYNYGNRPTSPYKFEDGPSPYVGMINLHDSKDLSQKTSSGSRNNTTDKESKDANFARRRYVSSNAISGQKRTRTSGQGADFTHSMPQGGYRIPEKGQLQIIIKNPNKTAVKLFLVPYDLEGMQPGQKTFIRQRSYSAGPIIDMPLSARKNFGTDRPEAALTSSDNPKDRPMLRYLIHLNICSPLKGRFYLYKSIRVVFANRVPDGKEKLRQEVQLPEPRFSAWKPEMDKVESRLDPQKTREAQRFSYATGCKPPAAITSPMLNQIDGLSTSFRQANEQQNRAFIFPLQNDIPTLKSPKPPSREEFEDTLMQTPPSPPSPRGSQHSCRGCVPPRSSYQSPSPPHFERLARDEYVGDSPHRRPQSPRPGEGLLALQFKDLSDSRPPSQGN